MSRNRYQPGPFRDRYGLGFRFAFGYGGSGPLLRNGTIVAVCYDGDEAQFVNAAGLAVPCVAMDGLPELLRHASRREYCKIVGDGQFAKPAHVLKSMEGAGTLRKWVTYYFDLGEFCLYYDDAAAWDAHVQSQLDQLDTKHFKEMAELEHKLQRRQQLADDLPPQLPAMPTPAELEERRQQAIARDLESFASRRRQALEQDQQLGAWLRGELPAPPLLRSVA